MDEAWTFTPVEKSHRGGTDVDSRICDALAEAARQDAMGHGKAAVRHAADALTLLGQKHKVNAYAVI